MYRVRITYINYESGTRTQSTSKPYKTLHGAKKFAGRNHWVCRPDGKTKLSESIAELIYA